MWKTYWDLASHPFPAGGRPYVGTETHDEAVARLVHAVTTGERLTFLRGARGTGKTAVLCRLATELRRPEFRFAVVERPLDGTEMASRLAVGLGSTSPTSAGRSAVWTGLANVVRVVQLQRIHPVLVVDDPRDLVDDLDRRDLERLTGLGAGRSAPLSVVLAVETRTGPDVGPGWELSVRLPPLTRTETRDYIASKLSAAGRPGPAFGPGAVARIHDLSAGVPRGIDRLATLALVAGALDRVDQVDARTVDDVARELDDPAASFAA